MTKKYLLEFRKDVDKPVLAECILATKARINILRADAEGRMLVTIPKEKEEEVISFLKKAGVKASEQKNAVEYDKDLCVDCGACISICPTNAFHFDEDKKLVYDPKKCVLCKLCIDACPRRALKAPEF
ncbi:MAG: 4Fe-4S binding protein [Candidatus Altiarchaeota archaeon]|nr:4Fe-4S binding protein [Candidatus Altiarchaeota archaeon]